MATGLRSAAYPYFWLPLGLLLSDKYNNERNIRAVTAPVLVLHGAQDEVIPVEMGWQVYRAANEPKRIEVFPQGSHSDLFDHGAWKTVQAVVDALKRIAQSDTRKEFNTRFQDGHEQRQAVSIAIDEERRVSGVLQVPRAARVCYVLAHGAGAGMSHPVYGGNRRRAR